MTRQGFKKCLCEGCTERAVIIFPKNIKKINHSEGYCRKHYGNGEWIRKQKLFYFRPYDLENRKFLGD